MKEYQITWQGTKCPIEINDKPTAGFCLKITKPPIMTYKVGQALPEINDEEYLIYLATNMITKAPWGAQTTPDTVRGLPKDTYIELCEILGNEFPIQDFLYPVVKLRFGKQLDIAASALQTASTTSLPSGESPSAK